MPEQDADITSLAQYVINVYREFVDNRKPLALKWERNLNAFRRVNNGFWKDGEAEGWRSNAFDAVTKQKIIAAVAICIDAYLAGGKIPFALRPSPIELEMAGIEDEHDAPEEVQAMIDARVEQMRKYIEAQFTLSKADQAMVKHFYSGAIYGLTYAKTAIETFTKSIYAPIEDTILPITEGAQFQFARYQKLIEERDSPAWNYITPWDVFTDYEETDLKKCHAVIHRQIRSPFELVDMLEGQPGVFDDEVKKALRVHTSRSPESADSTGDESPALRDVPNRKQNVRYLEYWGRIPVSVLDEFREREKKVWTLNEADDDEEAGKMVECLVGVIDDTVVRLAIVGDAEQRPFFCAKWEDNFDGQGGISVADNTEDVQKMRNSTIRLFFDNKALSANVQFAMKRELLLKKLEKFSPGQIVDIAEDCDDVRQALQQILVADVGESLISALNFTDQWADDDSMVPRVQQGSGTGGKETAFELSQRLEKSGKYLAMVMRNYDDGLVEPIAKWFYDWNMEDPEAEGKGSYEVFATGFTSFQDRINKLTAIRELLEVAAMLPPGQVKLVEIFRELAKLSDFDPDQFLVTEQEAAEEEPNPMMIAELEKINSETKRNEAHAQKLIAESQINAEKLKLEQIKAIDGE